MEAFFQELLQTFISFHFQYTEQFVVALLPVAVSVVLHGQGMAIAGRFNKKFTRRGAQAGPHILLLVVIAATMLGTHYAEIVAWAFFYWSTEMLPNFRAAMDFSLNAYTTLGASKFTLHSRWEGLGGFEAMTGMLMFGWSTAVLAAIVQRLYSFDDA